MGRTAVLPALIPEITKIYDVYFASFTNESMARLMVEVLFPRKMMESEEFRRNHTAGTLAFWHTSTEQYTFKCVDMETGEIIGMVLGDILLRERSDEERKFAGIPWLSGSDGERAEKIIRPLVDMRERLFGKHRHIYAHVIAVDPGHQGRHAGKAIIEWGIDLCNRTGLPLYLESSPTTAGLYTKMGFHVLSEKIVHKAELLGTEADVEVPLMVIMPSWANMTFEEWVEKGYPSLEKA